MTTDDVLFSATAVAYGAGALLFLAYLAGWQRAQPLHRVAPWLVTLGALLHGAQIVVSSLVLKVCPVEGVHFAMSVVSMMACATYSVARLRFRIDVVGAFVAPFALTFLIASRFVAVGGADVSNELGNTVLPLHVAANVLGDGLFTLACASAIAYLIQDRNLKQKKLSGLAKRLPPLDSLDRAEHRFLLAGFPLLTLGILTGTVWAGQLESGSAAGVARAVFGYATWLLFAAVLVLRTVWGWRGRRAAYGTIVGFACSVVVLMIYLVRAMDSSPVALLK